MDLTQFNSSQYGLETNNQEEADFFLKHLQPHHTVLEWGSGVSTKTIASKVDKIFSIEHNKEWYDEMCKQLPLDRNVGYLFVEQNSEPLPGHDGTLENYKDYVNAGLAAKKLNKNKPFDIIFIDGRARVECAKICSQIAHKDTLIFIHDYNHPEPKYTRNEYFEAENYLTRLDGEFTMWKFKVK